MALWSKATASAIVLRVISGWLALVLGPVGCLDTETLPDQSALKWDAPRPLAIAQVGELELTLLSDGPLQVGWNRVYYQLRAATPAIRTAELTATASLALGSQSLSAAAEVAYAGPLGTGPLPPESEGFVGALTFPQPGLAAADWTLRVVVALPGQPSTAFDLGPLKVLPSPWVRTVQAPGDQFADKYLVALHFPSRVRLGTSVYWLAIYRQQGPALPYLPLPLARLEVALDMPGMGHTAGQLLEPQWFVGALQQGQLTLSMPGEWRLTVRLYDGTRALPAVTFAWKV